MMAEMDKLKGIHCCICLNRGGERKAADTIVKGYAVCEAHVALVSRPEFDIFKLGGRQTRSGV